jgi:predicted RNA-binding protein with PUA-like domain
MIAISLYYSARFRYNGAMQYFLAKTDPDTYSLHDFEKEGETTWDGVHNNAAILFIRQMVPGDKVFIYESQSTKAIVGLAEVTSEPYENKDDPRRSWVVTMKFIKKYQKPMTLAEIKANPDFAEFKLVRELRLSVMPVPDDLAKKITARLGE